jgi:hypothetical protein
MSVKPSAFPKLARIDDVPPGYPQKMQGMNMSPEFMQKIWSIREMKGMRANAPMSMAGLMTALRVLPEDLY